MKDTLTIGSMLEIVILGELEPLSKGIIEGIHERIIFRIEDRKKMERIGPLDSAGQVQWKMGGKEMGM